MRYWGARLFLTLDTKLPWNRFCCFLCDYRGNCWTTCWKIPVLDVDLHQSSKPFQPWNSWFCGSRWKLRLTMMKILSHTETAFYFTKYFWCFVKIGDICGSVFHGLYCGRKKLRTSGLICRPCLLGLRKIKEDN